MSSLHNSFILIEFDMSEGFCSITSAGVLTFQSVITVNITLFQRSDERLTSADVPKMVGIIRGIIAAGLCLIYNMNGMRRVLLGQYFDPLRG